MEDQLEQPQLLSDHLVSRHPRWQRLMVDAHYPNRQRLLHIGYLVVRRQQAAAVVAVARLHLAHSND